MGRIRRISTFVITGNKNGSAGIALGKAPDAKVALRKAKNRAGQKLLYIEIFNNHTSRFPSVCVYVRTRTCACMCIFLFVGFLFLFFNRLSQVQINKLTVQKI